MLRLGCFSSAGFSLRPGAPRSKVGGDFTSRLGCLKGIAVTDAFLVSPVSGGNPDPVIVSSGRINVYSTTSGAASVPASRKGGVGWGREERDIRILAGKIMPVPFAFEKQRQVAVLIFGQDSAG